MPDYITQAYSYLTTQDLNQHNLISTFRELIEGVITFMYAVISVFVVVFLDRVMKQTEQYAGVYIFVGSLILIFRQVSNYFTNEVGNISAKQAKKSIQYLLNRDTQAINFKYESYTIGMQMMSMGEKKIQQKLLGSPYRQYLQQYNQLQKIRLKYKATSKSFQLLSSFTEFVLLFMLKVLKTDVDIWKFDTLVSITLGIKIIYLFGFKIVYGLIIKKFILNGKPMITL